MAALTWKNVEAPNFSGSTQALAVAGDALTNGVTMFGSAIDKYQANRRKALVDVDAAKLASFGSNEALQAALADGSFTPQTSEAAALAMDQRRALLGDDVTRGTIANNGLRLETGQYELGRTKDLAVRSDGEYAAKQAANPIIAKAQALADAGDYNGANKLALDNADLFAKAGIDTSGILNNNRGAVGAGQTVRTNTIQFNEQLRTEGIKQDSRTLLEKVSANPNFKTPEQIKQGLIDLRGQVPDEVIQGAIAGMGQIPLDPADAVNQQLDLAVPGTSAPARQRDNSWLEGPSNSKTPTLPSLLAKTEGGGKTNTLFGNAQKAGGAFEGVDVSKMTVGEVLDFQRPDGPYAAYVRGKVGRTATPVGAIQIVGTTLRNAAKEMGLSADTPFNAQTQQALFNHLADKRLSGPRTMEGKMAGMRAEWEGFKNVSDKDLATAITAYEGGDKTALTAFTDTGGEAGLAPLPTTGAGFSTLADPSTGISSRIDQLLADTGVPTPPPLSSGSSNNAASILNNAANGTTPAASNATGLDAPLTKGEAAKQATVDKVMQEALADPEATIALPSADGAPVTPATASESIAASIPKVDPKASAVVQDTQKNQRQVSLSNKLAQISQGIAEKGLPGVTSSLVDYFTATPEQGIANDKERARAAKAVEYLRSPEAYNYFDKNTDALDQAAANPIEFAERMMSQKKVSTAPVDQVLSEVSKPETAPRTDTIEKPKPVSQATVPEMIRRARSTMQVDRASNLNGSISKSLSDPEEDKKSVLDVSNELKTKGLSVNDTDREDAIARLSQKLNINPATAGILIQNSVEDTSFFGGLFGKESGINLDRAEMLYRAYEEDGKIDGGVSIQDTVARKAETEKAIAEAETLYTNVEAIYKQRLLGATEKEKKELKAWYEEAQKAIKKKLEAVNATGMLETYSRGKTSD